MGDSDDERETGVTVEIGPSDSADLGSSSAKLTKNKEKQSKEEKFLTSIQWKTITPTSGSLSSFTTDETQGDHQLFSAEAYKEYIVCVGGTSNTHGPFRGYKFIPTLHVTDSYMKGCCCCAGRWTEVATWKYRKATGEIPPVRFGQKTAIVNNTLFMFGGRAPGPGIGGGTLLNDLYALDLESLIWTHLKTKGDSPSPRIRHTLTYVDGFLYLLGGNGDVPSIFVKDCFWRYDIRGRTWDILPPCPTNDKVIAGHAAAAMGSQGMVVFGGCTSIFGREPNLFVFDTVGGGWARISTTTEAYKIDNAPEDHAVSTLTYDKDGPVTFFIFHGGICESGTTNTLAVLKHYAGEFNWHIPKVKEVNRFAPPIELSRHNIVFIKERILFMGGTTQFARESEEVSKGDRAGCCGVLTYKPINPAIRIPIIYLSKRKVADDGCCTIL